MNLQLVNIIIYIYLIAMFIVASITILNINKAISLYGMRFALIHLSATLGLCFWSGLFPYFIINDMLPFDAFLGFCLYITGGGFSVLALSKAIQIRLNGISDTTSDEWQQLDAIYKNTRQGSRVLITIGLILTAFALYTLQAL